MLASPESWDGWDWKNWPVPDRREQRIASNCKSSVTTGQGGSRSGLPLNQEGKEEEKRIGVMKLELKRDKTRKGTAYKCLAK